MLSNEVWIKKIKGRFTSRYNILRNKDCGMGNRKNNMRILQDSEDYTELQQYCSYYGQHHYQIVYLTLSYSPIQKKKKMFGITLYYPISKHLGNHNYD